MNKQLLRYVFADSTAVLADNYFFVFLAIGAAQTNAGPAQIGLLLTVYAIPRLLLLLPGGLVADLFSPRIIMSLGNAVQAIGMALLAVGFATNSISLTAWFVAAAVFGIVDAFNLPAVTGAAVRLVEKDALFRANRLRDGVGSTFQTLGFFAPGLAVTLLGAGSAAWIGCALYCVSAILFVSVRFSPPPDGSVTEKKLLKGFVYVWKSRPIRAVLTSQAVVYFASFGPLIVGLLLLIQEHSYDPVIYSVVLVAYSLGGIVGAYVSSRFERTPARGRWLLLEIPLIALVLLSMAYIPNVPLLCAGFAVLGGYSIITGVIGDTWRQLETTGNLQGRVGSVKVLVVELMKSLSRAVTGFAVAIMGLNGMFMVAAGLIVVAGIYVAMSHRRELLEANE